MEWTLVVLALLLHAILSTGGVAVTEVRLASPRPYVLQGESATLVCRYVVESAEEVTEVEWEKDGELVHLWTLGGESNGARGVLRGRVDASQTTPSTLTLDRVQVEMQGTYTCRVRTNGKTAHNEMFLMVIVDACGGSSWRTHTDMIECTEDLNMHCVGIFPKPSPACGVYSEKTGKYLNSVPFDSVIVLHNGTYEVSFHRRFSVRDWLQHPDLSFRCYMIVLGTPWRSGITHKMFGDPGCEQAPPTVSHGHANVTGETSCWGFPSEGARAEYRCEGGRTLHGSAVYVCRQGRWLPAHHQHPTPPTCSDGNGVSSLRYSGWIVALLLLLLVRLRPRCEARC